MCADTVKYYFLEKILMYWENHQILAQHFPTPRFGANFLMAKIFVSEKIEDHHFLWSFLAVYQDWLEMALSNTDEICVQPPLSAGSAVVVGNSSIKNQWADFKLRWVNGAPHPPAKFNQIFIDFCWPKTVIVNGWWKSLNWINKSSEPPKLLAFSNCLGPEKNHDELIFDRPILFTRFLSRFALSVLQIGIITSRIKAHWTAFQPSAEIWAIHVSELATKTSTE